MREGFLLALLALANATNWKVAIVLTVFVWTNRAGLGVRGPARRLQRQLSRNVFRRRNSLPKSVPRTFPF